MPQAFGHFLIGHAAINLINSDIAQAYVGHINFGTQGPDLFYITGQNELADKIHENGTLDFYSGLLERTLLFDVNGREHQALRAYAHAFYSHVVADCVFHPFVNRLADNNWAKTSNTELGTTNHQAIETLIDDCLLGLAAAHKNDFLLQLKCYDGHNADQLDPIIAEGLSKSFAFAYPALASSFRKNSFESAYSLYLTTNYIEKAAANLNVNLDPFLPRKTNLFRIMAPDHWTEKHKWAMNIDRTQWFAAPGNELLLYTGEELYHLAVKVAADVIKIAENFVQSRKSGALQNLKSSGHILLQENYNLDTGLPSKYNETAENRHPDSIIRFGFMAEQLLNNYRKFT